ncbi:MAG: PEGA domain-containing protein [Myxococcota bacterium]|nr:PEGA domain-containing protein [Myxococcota bacterium]
MLLFCSKASGNDGAERTSVGAFAVAKDASGNKSAAALNALLRAKIKSLDSFLLIEPNEALSNDKRSAFEAYLDRAREAFADAREAYDAMALDQAIARFGQSVNLYKQVGPLLGDLSEFKKVLSFYGAALALRGSADESKAVFKELLTLDANYELTGFNPLVTKVFNTAIEAEEKLERGQVEIYSTPANAAVFINGVFRGVSPLLVDQLAIGTHFVRIEKNGYEAYGGPLEITNQQSLTSQTRLRSIKNGQMFRDLVSRAGRSVTKGGMDGKLRELARTLLCDVLVVVSVTQSGSDISLNGGVYDRKSAKRIANEQGIIAYRPQNFAREVNVYLGRLLKNAVALSKGEDAAALSRESRKGRLSGFGLGDTRIKDAAMGGQSPESATGTPMEVVRQPSSGTVDGSPEPAQILGWGLVGLGSAGLITGAVFAGLAKNTHNDFLLTSQNSPDLPLIQENGKTESLTADLSFAIGGGITLIGATILTFHALKRPAPTELLGRSPGQDSPSVAFSPEVLISDNGMSFGVRGVY